MNSNRTLSRELSLLSLGLIKDKSDFFYHNMHIYSQKKKFLKKKIYSKFRNQLKNKFYDLVITVKMN